MSFSFGRSFVNRSIFVTGHTGFKGSWLCLWLHKLGARITGYALPPPTDPNNFTVSGIRELLDEHHEADVRDLGRLQAALKNAAPDVVFHLAAQSVVREGYRLPRDTFETNLMGTVNVLESVRQLNRPCAVVAVTSDKCYQNREQVWGYREVDPMGQFDPYGASKGAAELAIRCYRRSYFAPGHVGEHGVKLASGRAGNVLGGGDWTSHALLVDVVKALAGGRPVRVRNPGAFRPWQHVLQALSGYLTLAGALLESDDPMLCSGWNFGPLPGNELAVRDVVAQFLRYWGSGLWVDVSDPTEPRESNILRLAIDKAIWQLDWHPGWSVIETLREAARWYRHYLDDPGNMRELSLQQISAYEAVLGKKRPSMSVHLHDERAKRASA